MSIQKLVAPLGISTKTVYKYFANKEELLEESLRLYYALQQQEMEKILESHSSVPLLFEIWYLGIENECKVNKIFFRDLHHYYPEVEKKIEARISKKIWSRFIQIIRQGVKEGVFRADVDPRLFLEGISVLYAAIARKDQFTNFRIPTRTLFLQTITVYIMGICTPDGARSLEDHINGFKIFEGLPISNN
jgi:AcrR family transcriptional regulator